MRFKDIEWTEIDKDHTSLSWGPNGYELLIWEKPVGSTDNKVIDHAKIPAALHWAVYKEVDHANPKPMFTKWD